jgi:hypothetical protein
MSFGGDYVGGGPVILVECVAPAVGPCGMEEEGVWGRFGLPDYD